HPPDLVGAARNPRDERPRPGHARRPPGHRDRAQGRERGADHPGSRRRGGDGGVRLVRGRGSAAVLAAASRARDLGIFLALAATVLVFSIQATNFATVGNWQDIATDVAMVIAVAVGETMVVLTRNIDLSVGSVVGLTAYISSNTLAHHHGVPVAVIALIAVGVGLACGIGNVPLVVVGTNPAIIPTSA